MFRQVTAALLFCSLSNAAALPDHDEPFLEARASRFQYYTMPTALAGPCDLTTGPDGAIWVQDFLVNKIARIDPHTGDIKEYDIPYTTSVLNVTLPGEAPGRTGLTACAIQPGKDGNLYAATGVRNEFLKIIPSTGNITVFPTGNPLGNLEPLNDLYRGDKGMYFSQTTANKITFFDYKTEKMTDYEVPTPLAGPVGIYVASDNNVWFAEFLSNKIGRLSQTDGKIIEYPAGCIGPAVMRAENRENGKNYIYYTCFEGNGIGRIDIATGATDFFANPTALSLPTEDTVDSFGRIWFSTLSTNTINVLNAGTGKVRSIAEPDGIAAPVPLPGGVPPAGNVAVHYGPRNSIWFTELVTNRVGRYQLEGCGHTMTACTK